MTDQPPVETTSSAEPQEPQWPARRGAKAKPYSADGVTQAPAAPRVIQGPKRLGDLLAAKGKITAEQLRDALLTQSSQGERLGSTLVALGLLDERELAEGLAEQSGLVLVDLARENIDKSVATLLPESAANNLVAIPIRSDGQRIEVAVADPFAPDIQQKLIEHLGKPVRLHVAAGPDILQTLSSIHGRLGEMDEVLKDFEQRTASRRRLIQDQTSEITIVEENAPVVRVINLILEQAIRERASDVHIEPTDDEVRVRVRTDGAMHSVMSLPETMGAPLLSRLKVMADLNIVERRRPQDGNFVASVLGREIDVRLATSPTVFGEMAVLRLLDKTRSFYELSKLGMSPEAQSRYDVLIQSPFGLVVCAGPTGSGKTTTLYASLAAVNSREIKVMTIEDPVEYVIPSISQIQIHEAAGLTFATGLRAILRQDPDTILVGEIRDAETARIAVQAALTGHFVMSSLHATDASAALHRFLDMGIEPYLLASSLTGVVGQRLLRRNCPRCAEVYQPSVAERAFIERASSDAPKDGFMRGAGCNFCRNTGFFERVGIYEVLVVTDEIRDLMVQHKTQSEVRDVSMAQGMRPLAQQAVELAVSGQTSIAEVMRTVAVGL